MVATIRTCKMIKSCFRLRFSHPPAIRRKYLFLTNKTPRGTISVMKKSEAVYFVSTENVPARDRPTARRRPGDRPRVEEVSMRGERKNFREKLSRKLSPDLVRTRAPARTHAS